MVVVLSVVLNVAKAPETNKLPARLPEVDLRGGIGKTGTKDQVPGQAGKTDMGKR